MATRWWCTFRPIRTRDTVERKVRVPLMKVTQVVVMGDSTVTTPALLALLDQQVDVSFCDFHGRFRGQLASGMSRNGQLRVAQYGAHVDYGRRIALARSFVAGKLANQRTLLLRSNRKLEDDSITAAAATIQAILASVQQVIGVAEPADPSRPQADSAMGSLQGLEGAGRRPISEFSIDCCAMIWVFNAGYAGRQPIQSMHC